MRPRRSSCCRSRCGVSSRSSTSRPPRSARCRGRHVCGCQSAGTAHGEVPGFRILEGLRPDRLQLDALGEPDDRCPPRHLEIQPGSTPRLVIDFCSPFYVPRWFAGLLQESDIGIRADQLLPRRNRVSHVPGDDLHSQWTNPLRSESAGCAPADRPLHDPNVLQCRTCRRWASGR